MKHSSRISHKDAQLCQQAAEALAMALADSADPVLRDVVIADVAPAPDIARLRVTVHAHDTVDDDQLLARLERARGYLRGEMASAIHRKRTPDLTFSVEAAGAADPFA